MEELAGRVPFSLTSSSESLKQEVHERDDAKQEAHKKEHRKRSSDQSHFSCLEVVGDQKRAYGADQREEPVQQ